MISSLLYPSRSIFERLVSVAGGWQHRTRKNFAEAIRAAIGAGNGGKDLSQTEALILACIGGGLFVLGAVSVIVQVASFKLTGKRVFRMAPLHHHFEQKGWAEATIVIRFWIIACILAVAGLATLKLR